MIGLNNWAIIAICKHIIANNSLACAGVAVGVDEPMCYRVVISALEVIEPSLGVVVVASVAQRVDLRHCACGGEDVAPCVIGIGSHRRAAAIDQLDHIALQVQDIVIGGKTAAVVGGIIQGERQPLIIIDEIQNRCAAAAADRLPEYRICKHYSIFRILAQLAARCGGKTCIDFRKVMCYTI